MTEQQPHPLTFGIEFEFIIAMPHIHSSHISISDSDTPDSGSPNSGSPISDSPNSDSPNSTPASDTPDNNTPDNGKINFPSPYNWHSCADLIASTLTAHGIPTSRLTVFMKPTRGSWHVRQDISIAVAPDEVTPFWPAGKKNPHTHQGFEVISPILNAPLPSQNGSVISSMDFEKVLLVAQLITTKFRAFCNRSTGLHVHIDDGQNGFPISTIQKLMAFLYTFEPSIASLHPPHRRKPRAPDGDDSWCQRLRPTLISRLKNSPGIQVLDEVLSVPDIEALGILMLGWFINPRDERLRKPRRMAYNLSQLCSEDGLKTVEFRQHEGTLDGERVVLWAGFCVALVEFAGRVEGRNLRTYLGREIAAEEWKGDVRSVADLCHVIGFEEGMRAWGRVGEEEVGSL